jgi:hypothetical protein
VPLKSSIRNESQDTPTCSLPWDGSEANENKRKAGAENVEFLKGEIENIPLPDNSVDVVISNCVINRRQISLFLSLPLASLEKLDIQREIEHIGKQ